MQKLRKKRQSKNLNNHQPMNNLLSAIKTRPLRRRNPPKKAIRERKQPKLKQLAQKGKVQEGRVSTLSSQKPIKLHQKLWDNQNKRSSQRLSSNRSPSQRRLPLKLRLLRLKIRRKNLMVVLTLWLMNVLTWARIGQSSTSRNSMILKCKMNLWWILTLYNIDLPNKKLKKLSLKKLLQNRKIRMSSINWQTVTRSQ